MQEFNFNWVSSDGGPLIVMEEKYLADWEGCDEPSNSRVVEASYHFLEVATDYDRACDVNGYVGLVDVGKGKALVLGEDEMATTWIPLNTDQEGMLIRWFYGESESEVIKVAKSLFEKIGEDEKIDFEIEDSNLVLFAATESGSDSKYSRLNFVISSGKYRIFTKKYEDEETSIICHHLKLTT